MNSEHFIAAMSYAQDLWRDCAFLSPSEKIRLAAELDGYRIFSTMQIASISRLSGPTVRKNGFGQGIAGGRLNPEALSSLTILRKQYRLGLEQVSKPLVRICFGSGCSYGVVSHLTGIPLATLHRMMEER